MENISPIILDGPDGCGKSEIAKGLSRMTNVPYFRCGRQHEFFMSDDECSFKKALEYGDTLLTDFMLQTDARAVFDRAYPAEWVYSRVYARDTNQSVLESIDRTFCDMGAWIIIPVRHDYSKARADEIIDNCTLPVIHKEYIDEFRRWTLCNTVMIWVDSYANDLEQELDALRPVLKRYSSKVKLMVELDGKDSSETLLYRDFSRGKVW